MDKQGRQDKASYLNRGWDKEKVLSDQEESELDVIFRRRQGCFVQILNSPFLSCTSRVRSPEHSHSAASALEADVEAGADAVAAAAESITVTYSVALVYHRLSHNVRVVKVCGE